MTNTLRTTAALCCFFVLTQTPKALANTVVWTQNQTPQTTTDDLTAAFRNPAGMSFMEPGFHLNLAGQVVALDHQSTATELTGEYAGNEYGPKLTGVVPYLSAAYVGDRWTFFGFTLVDAGSPDAISYDPALLDFRAAGLGWVETELEIISAVFTYNFGLSYKLTDTFAVSFVATIGNRIDEVEVDIPKFASHAEAEGQGHGLSAQVGVAYQPNDRWFFSAGAKSPMKIDPNVNLESLDRASGMLAELATGVAVNTFRKTEIPWKLVGGARYSVSPSWDVSAAVLCELWNSTADPALRNILGVALGTDLQLTESFDVAAGIGYTTPPNKKKYATPTGSPNAPITLSVGAGLEFIEGHKLDLGAMLSTRPTWDVPEQGFEESNSTTFIFSLGYSLHI